MKSSNRRHFLKRTGQLAAVTAGVTVLSDPRSARGTPAADKILLAIVGLRGRGMNLAHGFLDRTQKDCEIAYLCDVDSRQFPRAKEIADRQGREPRCVQDFRRALDDKSVTAVVCATPDHWHALTTIWACQAGKDVYVEKPMTHNCWEGQMIIQAARKYGRIVQHGTQNRSAPYNIAAVEYIRSGKLGQIYMCKVFNQKLWANHPVVPDSEPPPGFDWDMWNGPAPEHPYNQGFVNYWNHIWRYSGGDIANDASHQIDLARWLCGVGHPKTVYSTGGRWASEGLAETPDTQVAVWEFDNLLMVFELTLYTPYMLKIDPEVRNSDMFPYWPQTATRIEIYGTEGLMIVGRHGGGWQVFDRPKSRQPVVKAQMYGRFPDPEHKQNFIEAIRTRKQPSAPPEEAHLSCLLIHYANISYRLGGEKLYIDPKTDHIIDNPRAMELFRRTYRPPWEIKEPV